MDFIYVVLAATSAGLLSLLLGALFINMNKKVINYITAFAGGTLISAAFLDLIHEAIEIESEDIFWILSFVIIGVLIFFILETFLLNLNKKEKTTSLMVMIGDSLHNFIDGIAISGAFLISPYSGLITTLAIMAHEIPQEIGDIAILCNDGMTKKRAIYFNAISSLASLIGALIFFGIGKYFINELNLNFLSKLLSLVAGFFIYISLSDIIPTLHKEKNKKVALIQLLMLVFGVVLMALLIYTLHPLVE